MSLRVKIDNNYALLKAFSAALRDVFNFYVHYLNYG